MNAAEKRIDRLVQHVAPGAMLLGAELHKHGKLDRQQIDGILSKTLTRLKSPRTNWNGSGAAAQDEEQNMPMQQLEDPDKISATTTQSRGPTQHEQYSRRSLDSERVQISDPSP